MTRLFALAVLVSSACAHTAAKSRQPTAAWIDAALIGDAGSQDDTLAALERGDPHAQVVRLDRLLDLFDAARFGQDEDARETLWTALGGHGTGVGDAATRDAQARLLALALGLDRALTDPDDPLRRFVADAIMLLTADLEPATRAEDLAVRTLAYRTLVERGHPRIADNARWRLYDHVRGTLAGATEVPPEQRLDVAVQALYADRESVAIHLADTSVHARPPFPSIDALFTPLGEHKHALADDPRWAAVVQARAPLDDDLRDTIGAALPASREIAWPLARLSAGTAKAESLAPVLRIVDGTIVIDDGRPGARTLPLGDDVEPIAAAIRAALATDGRGTVLLVADPGAPAPHVHATLRALRRASAGRIEIAVHEPRLDPAAPPAVLALPILVARDGDGSTATLAVGAARVHVHLDGRGPALAVDGGRMMGSGDADLEADLEAIASGFPTERIVRLTLGSDVQLRQLTDLLVALTGGPARRFAAVAWQPGGEAPPERKEVAAFVAARAAIGRTAFAFSLERPFALKADDDGRLVQFVEQLSICLPELAAPFPKQGLSVTLPFAEGALGPVQVGPVKAKAAAIAALRACIDERGRTFRLRHHRDAMAIEVTIQPAR